MAPNKTLQKAEEIIGMTKGSKYRVLSKGSGDQPLESVGVFKGYTAFGHDSALSLMLEEKEGVPGRTRLIPCTAVLAVDVIEFRPEEKVEEKEEVKVYFN
ncbi:MAG: hypothetical protein QW520_01455 [Methanomassiliicoccales archaeon]